MAKVRGVVQIVPLEYTQCASSDDWFSPTRRDHFGAVHNLLDYGAFVGRITDKVGISVI